MADTMQFDLVSPERSLVSAQAMEVRIPGAEGDMTAMANHAPVITTLRPGVLTVVTEKGEDMFFVTGGFAEVSAEGTSVLAERAYSKADMTQDIIDELVGDAKEAADGSDVAAKFLSDLVAAGSAFGLEARGS
jgi:F-type H+-transporting ATPase subunit epsilon